MEGQPLAIQRHPDPFNFDRWLLSIRITHGIGPGRIVMFGEREDIFRDFDELHRRVNRRYRVERDLLREVWDETFASQA